MPSTEPNLQLRRVLDIIQMDVLAAIASGKPFRINFDTLTGSGGRLHDWGTPATSFKEPLAKISVKP